MDKDEIKSAFKKLTEGNEFILNPDNNHVDFIIDGILRLEKEHGLKYCPCRLRIGDRKKDLELVCPCNFFIQNTWKEQGRCWCGLFVRR
ncbi:MAG: ferredoxin-thioredoxin reductase catalytic domain-containing protein [Candidatus Micrarchaeota archaeon]